MEASPITSSASPARHHACVTSPGCGANVSAGSGSSGIGKLKRLERFWRRWLAAGRVVGVGSAAEVQPRVQSGGPMADETIVRVFGGN